VISIRPCGACRKKEGLRSSSCRPDMLRRHPFRLIRWPLAILFFALVVPAQSGRGPKTNPAAAPTTPAPTETKVNPAKAKTQPSVLPLIIVNSVNSAKAAVWTGLALRELIQRLEEPPNVKVTQEKDMSRKEVIARAKTENKGYVVWVQFEIDASMGRIDRDDDAPIVTGLNPGCLFINYVVFEPGTANIKAQDRVYQAGYQAQCTGTAIQSGSPPPAAPQRHPPTETLAKTARDAADGILSAVNVLRTNRAYLRK
jgi:hypothetical protein